LRSGSVRGWCCRIRRWKWRLTLRFAGESLPFGDELPAEERPAVARELRRALAVR
jgi:hypothetical protein